MSERKLEPKDVPGAFLNLVSMKDLSPLYSPLMISTPILKEG